MPVTCSPVSIAVRAPVTTLMLLVNRRIDPLALAESDDRAELFGDPAVLSTALESLAQG